MHIKIDNEDFENFKTIDKIIRSNPKYVRTIVRLNQEVDCCKVTFDGDVELFRDYIHDLEEKGISFYN